jgi:hypothetical protein
VRAAVDVGDAADRHRLEEAGNRAGSRHGIGNMRDGRPFTTEDDPPAVAESHRREPEVTRRPVRAEQRAERRGHELGRHGAGRERARQHDAGPVQPERSQRRPGEQRRRRHPSQPAPARRTTRQAGRPSAHPGPTGQCYRFRRNRLTGGTCRQVARGESRSQQASDDRPRRGPNDHLRVAGVPTGGVLERGQDTGVIGVTDDAAGAQRQPDAGFRRHGASLAVFLDRVSSSLI